MADLLTLSEYKALIGVATSNTRNDAQISALLPAASRAVRLFTDRKFDAGGSVAARSFEYDGSGYLETDDFTNLISITTDGGVPGSTPTTLDSSQYDAQPYRETSDDDPYYYIVIRNLPPVGSPQMGFRQNLDTYEWPGQPQVLTVVATWGWPAIPADVQLACAWTIEDAIAKPVNDDLRAESIAGYSRSWGATPAASSLALPQRARDLLTNYIRVF